MGFFGPSRKEVAALQREIQTLRGTFVEDGRVMRTEDGGLENLLVGVGTALDRTQATKYVDVMNLTQPDAENAYRATWLARKMTNLPADEMFREWITLSWDGSGDNSADVQSVIDELEKLQVRWKGRSCKRWARLYGGSAFVCGLGSDDLTMPYDREKVKKGDVRWMHPFDRYRLIAVPSPLTSEPESPNYGKPNFYQLMNIDGTPITGSSSGLVHWTRVIRFEGEEVPWFKFRQNGYWHDSKLLSIIDSLKGYSTTTAGIAQMVFDANVDVMKSKDLIKQIAAKNGKQTIFERYSVGAMLKSMYRMLIIDKDNEDYDRKSYAFSGLSQVMNEFRVDCAGASSLPVTKLFGTSATGLNATGEGDQTSFYDDIAASQESELRYPLLEVVKLVVGSVLGKIPKGLTLEFDPLWQMSDAQDATVQLQRAQARKIYFDMSAVGSELIAKTLYREKLFPDMEKRDVTMAKALEGTAREESLNAGGAPAPSEEAGAKKPGAQKPPQESAAAGAEE